MTYIEAPNFSLDIQRLPKRNNLFLAGSITGARNWQKEIAFTTYNNTHFDIRLVDEFNVFNPRRENFDASDANVEKEQITWEFHCINQLCDKVLFWFSHETVAPITLFEYGKILKTHAPRNVFVGIDPEYKRKNDVIIQTCLEYGISNPDQLTNPIQWSIEDLATNLLQTKSRDPFL